MGYEGQHRSVLWAAAAALAGLLAAPGAQPAWTEGGAVGESYWIALPAPDFPPGLEWINSTPLTLKDLRGKVVLVDFWEYTCVNCLRTLPYIRSWNEQYAAKGLVIIGVHTPEFAFGRDKSNVERAAKALGITYPIVLDNDYQIWSAWRNAYWPRKFLVDGSGVVRYDHAGEGGYQETEATLQRLLRELDPTLMPQPPIDYVRLEDRPGAVCYPRTPETYAGYSRGVFAMEVEGDREALYRGSPDRLDGHILLEGRFRVEEERLVYAGGPGGPGAILLAWHGTEVNAVLHPGTGTQRVEARLDGGPIPREMAGKDVRYTAEGKSYLDVTEPRMYRIVDGRQFGRYLLGLTPTAPGLALYAYTFGGCVQD